MKGISRRPNATTQAPHVSIVSSPDLKSRPIGIDNVARSADSPRLSCHGDTLWVWVSFVDGARLRARKRTQLSQHFLREQRLASSLVGQSSISGADLVVEIGPGRGALTREWPTRCGRLIAVELEGYFAKVLDTEFEKNSGVEVAHEDFLRFDLPRSQYKVFGNIPFDKTHKIVQCLVNSPVRPDDVYLIVRREDAERISGHPFAPESRTLLLLKPW